MFRTQYNRIAEKYFKAETIIKRYSILPTFLKLINKVEGLSVLDLACGSGYFTRRLKQKGATKVVGIDISKEQIKIARDIEKERPLGIKYVVGDVKKLDIKKLGTFNLVTAVFLLNYAKNKEELYKMCRNISNITNEFATITANPFCPGFRYRKYEITKRVLGKLREGCKIKVTFYKDRKPYVNFYNYYWSKETYQEILKKSGFKKIRFIKPIISKEGYEKFGKNFWRQFLEKPTFIGIKCKK